MPTREEWIDRYKKHISENPISGHGRRIYSGDSDAVPCRGHPCHRCLVCVVGEAITSQQPVDICATCPQAIPESRISLELLIADSLSANQQKENL